MTAIALLQTTGGTSAFLINILPIAAIFLVFYFLVIAPANKQRRSRPALIPRLLRLLPILQHDISGAGSRIGASAHPYRRRRRLDAGETLR